MNTILKFILGYILDSVKDWAVGYFKKERKKAASAKELATKRARVKKAIEKAYDGEPLTKEQKDELLNSYRDLIRS